MCMIGWEDHRRYITPQQRCLIHEMLQKISKMAMLPFSSGFQCRLLGPLYNQMLTTSDKLMKIMVSRPQKLGIEIPYHSQHDGVCSQKRISFAKTLWSGIYIKWWTFTGEKLWWTLKPETNRKSTWKLMVGKFDLLWGSKAELLVLGSV